VSEAKPADLKITQIKSSIGAKHNQRESLRTLGLRGIRQTVVRADNAQNRGLINVVRHLVTIEEISPAEVAK
jgi:large subunit ribosomal protein L30